MTTLTFNLDDLLTFRRNAPATIAINIHEQLATKRQIAIIWSIEDVQEVRPDLTEEQAWEVLEQVKHAHDATIGISWETLQSVADDQFAPVPTSSNGE